MIIYSVGTQGNFVAVPGERLVYGLDESHPMGYGEVAVNPEGELVVNGQRVSSVLRRFSYVRKV